MTDAVGATTTATIATGIIPVITFPASDVAALFTELEEAAPGRFVAGLGGAHGADPLRTLHAYLDELEASRRANAG